MNNLSQDFKKSILSQEAISLAKDYSEIAIDSIINEGLLKDIPIISTIAGLYKIGYSIKERHMIKKIATFLNCMSDISDDEKDKFLLHLNDEDKKGGMFEKLFIILGRLDEMIKAEMMGNLFRMYIMEVLNWQMFLRCSNIVEKAFVADLISLHLKYSATCNKDRIYEKFDEFIDKRQCAGEIDQCQLNLGLMDQELNHKESLVLRAAGRNGTESCIKTKTNSLGKTLATFFFYDLEDEDFRYVWKARKIII